MPGVGLVSDEPVTMQPSVVVMKTTVPVPGRPVADRAIASPTAAIDGVPETENPKVGTALALAEVNVNVTGALVASR